MDENDAERCERQRLAQKLDDHSSAINNDINSNSGMDKIYFTPNELLYEATCTNPISSTLSLSSPKISTTMIGVPDSEFPSDNATSNSIDKCHEDSNNDSTDNIETKVPCQCQSHLGRIFLDEIYPLTTEQLFTILFSPIPWYQHFHEIVNKTGYMATSWVKENPTITTRTVTYNMALNNALGPKSTSVTEKQTCHAFHGKSDNGFSVMKEIQNAGIPYADNFTIQCTYCIIRAGNMHSRLLIHGTIIQKKNIWGIVKGIIEKSTYSGLATHYTVLEETLKLLCDESFEVKQSTISECETSNNLLPSNLLNGYANIDISFLSTKIARIEKCQKNK
ncbi:unnamed protein product [Wuchereria bancrofti]|uniref:VASt domain-containing protein n=1 Tax=Wuchereria bancrofti TaxID=6293 RepID=A0A3P7E011_WUCBA|nr:unnamed protein product [Wuchereria bancrofti]